MPPTWPAVLPSQLQSTEIQRQKIKTFWTLVAPQNKNQCLPNFACSLLTTTVNFSTPLEIQFLIFTFSLHPNVQQLGHAIIPKTK
jgi:hypothetical protein